MKKLPLWVKLPSRWIEERGLRDFRWTRGEGANNLAGLMSLAVIAHHADADTGVARLTYDDVSAIASLSRAKLSAGLSLLAERNLVEPGPGGRSHYRLVGYQPASGWAKFPAAALYSNGVVAMFASFHLRLRSELDALKLYFLLASRRDRNTGLTRISYDKIEEYAGIPRPGIVNARSVLAAHGLVRIEFMPSTVSEKGVASAYRLAYLDSYRHMGTIGRRFEDWDADGDTVTAGEAQKAGDWPS
jgi:hypothetical protein